jgi:hypothetical protein
MCISYAITQVDPEGIVTETELLIVIGPAVIALLPDVIE